MNWRLFLSCNSNVSNVSMNKKKEYPTERLLVCAVFWAIKTKESPFLSTNNSFSIQMHMCVLAKHNTIVSMKTNKMCAVENWQLYCEQMCPLVWDTFGTCYIWLHYFLFLVLHFFFIFYLISLSFSLFWCLPVKILIRSEYAAVSIARFFFVCQLVTDSNRLWARELCVHRLFCSMVL